MVEKLFMFTFPQPFKAARVKNLAPRCSEQQRLGPRCAGRWRPAFHYMVMLPATFLRGGRFCTAFAHVLRRCAFVFISGAVALLACAISSTWPLLCGQTIAWHTPSKWNVRDPCFLTLLTHGCHGRSDVMELQMASSAF